MLWELQRLGQRQCRTGRPPPAASSSPKRCCVAFVRLRWGKPVTIWPSDSKAVKREEKNQQVIGLGTLCIHRVASCDGWYPKCEGLLRISGCIKLSTRLCFLISTHNCGSLLRSEPIDIFSRRSQEHHATSSACCKTRQKAQAKWRYGNTVYLGQDRDKDLQAGLVIREWSRIHLRLLRMLCFPSNLIPTKLSNPFEFIPPTTASVDDAVEEFSNVKLKHGRKTEEVYWTFATLMTWVIIKAITEAKKLFVGKASFRKNARQSRTWTASSARIKKENDCVLIGRCLYGAFFNTGRDHCLMRPERT